MTSGLRKLALTTHVTSSVGWLGSVVAFLALAVAGVSGVDAETVRAAYLAMHLITWFVIVPFSLAALLTGLVQSLGTAWGLFRHHWIVAKLGLTVVATIILLAHTQPIGQVAAAAEEALLSSSDLRQIRIQLIADAGAAVMALLVATTLSVYKPWGLTPYGRRRSEAVVMGPSLRSTTTPFWRWVWLVGLIIAIAVFVFLHLTGSGLHAQ